MGWKLQSIREREGKIEIRMVRLGRDGNYGSLVRMGPQELICSSGYDLAKVMVSYFNRGSNSKCGA